jgi:hypothetical protein
MPEFVPDRCRYCAWRVGRVQEDHGCAPPLHFFLCGESPQRASAALQIGLGGNDYVSPMEHSSQVLGFIPILPTAPYLAVRFDEAVDDPVQFLSQLEGRETMPLAVVGCEHGIKIRQREVISFSEELGWKFELVQ